MPEIISARTLAVTYVAEPYPKLSLGHITSTSDLIEAFSKFKLNGRSVKKVKKAPQPADVVTRAPTTNINNIDVERLAEDISAMKITKPARRLAQRQAPAVHPYKRPALTKTEKILSSHGMAKKGTPVVPDNRLPWPPRVNRKQALHQNEQRHNFSSQQRPQVAFDSPFNWSTAWLSSASAAPSSSPVIEAQVHVTSASNNYGGGDLYTADMVVAVASVMKNRKSTKALGKVTKARATKPVISKFDAEVASLADMLSLCQLTKGSNGNADLTQSKSQAARKAACHNSGYEGGHED